jgi:hypothetical protein
MADSIAESARKASACTWRKPRVRIYDYNQASAVLLFITIHRVSHGLQEIPVQWDTL